MSAGVKIFYRQSFIREYDKLENSLKEEVKEKIALFQADQRHPSLRMHKLSGKLKGCMSFSVNYRYRIIFYYFSKDAVALLDVGDHDVYK